MLIRNPVDWVFDQLRVAGAAAEKVGRAVGATRQTPHVAAKIRRIGVGDLLAALAAGVDDFAAYRTDVIFICIIYPVAGLILGRIMLGNGLLPLLFPLASGFALIGPFAAVGIYEMSRRREQGLAVSWPDAFALVRSSNFGGVVVLGLALVALFLVWLAVADQIYALTLGPARPSSFAAFVHDVFNTDAGIAMIVVGIGVGFLFAVVALAIGVVSFPLLIDRGVPVDTAVMTSVRAVAANSGPMALWGLIVAAGLVIGSIPLLAGLVVVMPILGHATWHLYRALVPR
jgi:uncharacterized membrane protein